MHDFLKRQNSALQVRFFSCLLLSSLYLSDAHVYEPSIRALLETASRHCEVVVLKLPVRFVVERTRHTYDSQGHISAVDFRKFGLQPVKLVPYDIVHDFLKRQNAAMQVNLSKFILNRVSVNEISSYRVF